MLDGQASNVANQRRREHALNRKSQISGRQARVGRRPFPMSTQARVLVHCDEPSLAETRCNNDPTLCSMCVSASVVSTCSSDSFWKILITV